MQNHQRVSEAFAFAAELHHDHFRKVGPNEPKTLEIAYMTHLAEVFAFVIQGFGDDDQMIAALLHDSIEDRPVAPDGRKTRDVILEKFGQRVLDLVLANTDSETVPGVPKEAWLPRKEKHIAHIRALGADDKSVLLVGLADKLSNGHAIVNDINTHGTKVWHRFKKPTPAEIAWYYTSMLRVFQDLIPENPLVPRLAGVVKEIQKKSDEVGGQKPAM